MTTTTLRRIASLLALFPAAAWLGLPATAAAQGGAVPILFHTADQCMACHNQLTAPNGDDVSIGFNWRSSMMGNAGRDPYWMAGVRRESLDHPAALAVIEDKCTVCHLPMARTTTTAMGEPSRAFEHFPVLGAGGPLTPLAQDGVSCTACHQIQNQNLGTRAGFTGGYVIDLGAPMGSRAAFGPFEPDAGRARVMRSASELEPRKAAHIQSAEFCANCHTLLTHAMDPDGNEAGELPEQTPYLEWLESDYPGEKPCQTCHMPVVPGEVSVTSVLPNPRTEVSQHIFRGGNFLMPRILNKHRAELNVQALPQEFEATAMATGANLSDASARVGLADMAVVDGRLDLSVKVTNLAGHKLPSAYPSRRAWVHLRVEDQGGRVVFESGAVEPSGRIQGNDNDNDAARFEPHYDRITAADQVQIYEDIMVDYAGAVTTGLLWGARYIKDNRLLPRGFDKAAASPDVAVHGAAAQDADFLGGSDVVRYSVGVGGGSGPFRVVAELWYQPIGYRWAMNLAEYDTAESAQFLRFFNEMTSATAALLARTEETLR